MFVIDCLIANVITRFTASPDKLDKLIYRLSLIEYAIANHCRKLAGELDSSLIPPDPQHTHHSDNQLAQFLWEQYIEERLHGQMLAALLHEPSSNDGGIGKCKYLQGWVADKQVEGLSNISPFWWLLGGKRAEDFELCDRLAMMSVLENYSRKFYECLFHVLPNCPLRRLADKISVEEIEHSEALHAQLNNLVGRTKAIWLILKWKVKALLVLPDALRLGLVYAQDNEVEIKHDAVI